MKVAFCDKLFNLLNEFEDNNDKEITNQLQWTPKKKTEETKSLYSTSSSFNQRATKKQDLIYEQHYKEPQNQLQEVDKGLLTLRQKISLQTTNDFISPKKPYSVKVNQTSRNKIQKKLDYLNTDCFYKTSRAFYNNKPIVSFNLPIFSSVTNSLEMNSPTKKVFHHKSTISELVNSKKIKQYGEAKETNRKIKTDSIDHLKKIENNINPPSIREIRKQKEVNDLNQFKIFQRKTYQ